MSDVLSQVLRTVHLSGAVFFDVDGVAPWVAEAPTANVIASAVMPGKHVAEYHVVTHGSCYGGLVGEPAVELHAGDVIVFPQGDAHVMSSQPGMRGGFDLEMPVRAVPIALEVGPRNVRASDVKLVCGFLACDVRPYNPLIASLPRVIVARAGEGPSENWLELFVRLASEEAKNERAGGQCVLGKLSELMFIEVIRRHLERHGGSGGWLAALADPQLGRAMARIHDDPGAAHTLEDLAKAAAMSRSAFAERFSEVVGVAPMQYLTRWRMQVAADLLSGPYSLAEIAARVGYASEAAFHRAFKKIVGVSPGAWRRGEHEAPTTTRSAVSGPAEAEPDVEAQAS